MEMSSGKILLLETISRMRDKPSTKARERSYKAVRSLFHLLDVLMVSHPFYNDNYDYKGWKNWVVKYTPIDKRGGRSESGKKKMV